MELTQYVMISTSLINELLKKKLINCNANESAIHIFFLLLNFVGVNKAWERHNLWKRRITFAFLNTESFIIFITSHAMLIDILSICFRTLETIRDNIVNTTLYWGKPIKISIRIEMLITVNSILI